MLRKTVLVMFGGVSAEHEVSVITGLQVLENLDYDRFDARVVYVRKDGLFYFYPRLTHRSQWTKVKPVLCSLGRDTRGAYVREDTMLGKKHYIQVAYLAFHGGNGEDGTVQGMLQMLGVPITSPAHEGSVIAMNKILMKQLLMDYEIPCVPGTAVFAREFKQNRLELLEHVKRSMGLPVIIKPAHLGSSIGINVARDEAALVAHLSAACLVDSEVLVERLLEDFVEFNVSVREHNGEIVCSEIERPKKQDEILSFADKYQREGGKKQQSAQGGMASLSRELPAKISEDLAKRIQAIAKRSFAVCRLGGMVRIDMMYVEKTDTLYVNEINTIPGSVAFYLWEASGIQFRDQISQSIEQAFVEQKERDQYRMEYETDIVEKFVSLKS